MAAAFNAISFAVLSEFLLGLGFSSRTITTKSGHEVVFEISNRRDPRLVVCVYTSCSPTSQQVRGRGEDAIRVCLVLQSEELREAQQKNGWRVMDGRLGLTSTKRVNRAGSTDMIFSRIHARARDMYRLSNQMIKARRCSCGAHTYPDTGRCTLRNWCPTNGQVA